MSATTWVYLDAYTNDTPVCECAEPPVLIPVDEWIVCEVCGTRFRMARVDIEADRAVCMVVPVDA